MMARCIRENYPHYDGFVICHGTVTMASHGGRALLPDSEFPQTGYHHRRTASNRYEDTDARINLLDSPLLRLLPGCTRHQHRIRRQCHCRYTGTQKCGQRATMPSLPSTFLTLPPSATDISSIILRRDLRLSGILRHPVQQCFPAETDSGYLSGHSGTGR